MKKYKQKKSHFWNLVSDKSVAERDWLRYSYDSSAFVDKFLCELLVGEGRKFSFRLDYGETSLAREFYRVRAQWVKRILSAVAEELGVQGCVNAYPVMNTTEFESVVGNVWRTTTVAMVVEFAPLRVSAWERVKGLFS